MTSTTYTNDNSHLNPYPVREVNVPAEGVNQAAAPASVPSVPVELRFVDTQARAGEDLPPSYEQAVASSAVPETNTAAAAAAAAGMSSVPINLYFVDTEAKAGEDLPPAYYPRRTQAAAPASNYNAAPASAPQVPINIYYVDSISRAGEEPTQTYYYPKTNAAPPASNYYAAPDASPVKNPFNVYYVDTMAGAPIEAPQYVPFNVPAKPAHYNNHIENHFDAISQSIDDELLKHNIDFEKLQAMIFKIVMLHMRKAAKVDQEYISELNVQIKAQSLKVQETYNTWMHVGITVISATVSIGAGVCGLSPFAPASFINADTARNLAANAVNIGTAGTGINYLGGIANSRSEGKRGYYQLDLQRAQGKEEDRKGARHNHNDIRKNAKEAHAQFMHLRHETNRSMMGS